MRASRPPGPKLLLLDFLRLAANELVTSTVAFSFSIAFRTSVCAPIDLRVRRVAGTVASVAGAIVGGVIESCQVEANSKPWTRRR
ncbi:hypothetical protein B0J15DRAFT_104699 [Fusarium solani]|uniref:Secreted protein n=1 Tax=Fusarium solani TaxID=169388 RepID=A0A9P9L436_FUSSL|nr:uncharacterized protein B0J15DRAFT_104699 [Fusarium solani]KAH7273589.1 hypothetical protein B0J15DRAFT_104699 [Fusarium solani]